MFSHGVPLGVYLPGTSLIHRVPTGMKLGFLIVFVLATAVLARTPLTLSFAAAIVGAGYCIAHVPLRIAREQLTPPALVMVPLALVQWWQQGLLSAALTFAGLWISVAAAVLFTLTTQVAEVMDCFEPLVRRFSWGETFALAVSMTLRLIPLQLATLQEVKEARAARGVHWSLSAFGVPVIVRSIKRARALSEALAARGYEGGEA